MAASLAITVDDRVQTVLNATGIPAAVNNHATLIDSLQLEAVQIASFSVAAGDFTADVTTETFSVVTPSATRTALIEEVWVSCDTMFGGGTISACTVAVGSDTADDVDAYNVARSVFTGATAGITGFASADLGVDLVPATRQPVLPAGDSVTVTFVSTDGNLDDATTGELTVYVKYRLI